MQLSIIYIINNKLHTFKYLNYTIIFYIILFYTYYSLLVYLLNKNYTMLILYFMFFILVYSFYKNFTYFIGFAFLIISEAITASIITGFFLNFAILFSS